MFSLWKSEAKQNPEFDSLDLLKTCFVLVYKIKFNLHENSHHNYHACKEIKEQILNI